jgi:class 3 adenylate cyclase
MHDINEYSENTNPYELFTHIYWSIINRKISLVCELEDYLADVPENTKKDFTFKSAFRMLKEMHWGFFSDLDPINYPILWKQLTIPHSKYPSVGELKRSMSITDIYTAFIDIHGYTAFCQEYGQQTSMLQLLDSCIEKDIRQICRDNQVMGNRARGDEIIIVGTSAYNVLNTVIMISDYLGDRKLTKDTEIVKKRNGQALKLPRLTISAGIAGGKKYAVLVITAAGDLSGSVVNTAARLQGRANQIAKNKSHILTTNQVVANYKNTRNKLSNPLFSENDVPFLDLGPVGFKGVELRLAEVVIEADQMYRASYQKTLNDLIDALRSHSWSNLVFESMTNLITEVAKAIPPFEINLPESSEGLLSVSNRTVIMMIGKINDLFFKNKDYSAAMDGLRELSEILVQIKNFDHSVILYLHTVIDGYSGIVDIYKKHVSTYSEKYKEKIFGIEEVRKFERAKTSSLIYDMMKEEMIKRIEPDRRKVLWMRLAKDLGQEIDSMPYLAK